jgi:hypothetical protein
MNASNSRRPQISLSFMLLMNVIFCVLAGAFYYASQVPAIADEVSMMLGDRPSSSGGSGRKMHMIFVMFTYTAPLLLAGVLATVMGVWRRLEQRR